MFSSLALATSLCSLVVSIMTYRSAGPRVSVAAHAFSLRNGELWLEVRLANAGKGEVDLDGATCDLLGPTVTILSYRLKAAASHTLLFRGPIDQSLAQVGSATVNVGLGNGRSLVAQVRFTDDEQAALRLALQQLLPAPAIRPPTQGTPRLWLPPTQEEV